jgi:spore coat protein A
MYPGPTIETRSGQPIAMRWVNNLPTTHFLPVDPTIHGAEPPTPAVRTVVHLHGAKVLPESDGYPEAWFTSDGQTGPDFNPNPYLYPNDQQACGLWYHDHALGTTRLNVFAGLEGFYFIRDAVEDALNLPSGQYEIPLMIQDRMFNSDGSLFYPTENATHPLWVPEFFGDTVLVNGKVWPYLDVEPRKYRFRMLNGANARFWHMTLVETTANGVPTGNPGPMFNQIGTDGGLLPAPVQLTELLMAPAERFDIVIDFSGLQGKTFVLKNDAPAPYPDGGDVVPTEIMMFRVRKPLAGRDASSLPSRLNPVPLIKASSAVKQRNLTLTELDRDSDGFPIIGLLGNLHWDDPVTENPKAGSVEIWNLINNTGDAHPKHIHLVQFQVLNRQPFNQPAFDATGRLIFTAPPMAPDPNERPAWKDTVKTYPGMVTRVIAKFDLPTGTKTIPGQRFRYAWHCHILEHEDNEMMRPYDVVA